MVLSELFIKLRMKKMENFRQLNYSNQQVISRLQLINLFFTILIYHSKLIHFNYEQTGMHQDHIDVKYVLREVEAMMKVKGERIVRYFDSWMDSNDNIYIQMEFCSNNLKNILQNWKSFFQKTEFSANE